MGHTSLVLALVVVLVAVLIVVVWRSRHPRPHPHPGPNPGPFPPHPPGPHPGPNPNPLPPHPPVHTVSYPMAGIVYNDSSVPGSFPDKALVHMAGAVPTTAVGKKAQIVAGSGGSGFLLSLEDTPFVVTATGGVVGGVVQLAVAPGAAPPNATKNLPRFDHQGTYYLVIAA